jgi:predicted SnoaL-like aldol condensation-catalyzing enzyme
MTRTSEEQKNLDLVLAMFANVLEPMDSSAVDRYIHPEYIQHNPTVAPGRDALKAFLDHIRQLSPHATHDIKRAFVDGDHVIVHYNVRRWEGDKGFAVMDVFRIENDLIREHWDVVQDVVLDGPNPNSQF